MNFCYNRITKRISAVLLLIILLGTCAMPFSSFAKAPSETVRVGWYESPFNSTDKSGRRSGYAYEYQLKIAAYSGWDYTYVNASWSDLMQMLVDGEIDVLSDVSYTEERAEKMLFSELPMGTEEYCIFIAPGNRDITPEDLSTLNGKHIGVNKGSVQAALYQKWANKHEIEAQLEELTCTEVDSLDMLETGKLDAYITLNAYGDPEKLVPVCKIGSSDFYFAVNNSRPDLLAQLNAAMSIIHDEDPYYNQKMFEKYVQRFGTNAFATVEDKEWLASHGTIRVGYQDNYLAFCAKDPETGKLTGALKDYLEYASDCISNLHIDFEAVPYETVADALDAMERGQIDCVFPANLTSYDGEELNILVTPSLMRTDVYAVVRQADSGIIAKREHVIVAVNKGNPNYDAFLIDNYPSWRKVYFDNITECLDAVYMGIADCVLISNYRFNNISKLCDRYQMTTYTTGKGLDYSFAVSEAETELYSILAKVIGLVPDSTVNAMLSYYIAQDAKLTLGDFITGNLGYVAVAGAVVLFVIVLFMAKSMRAERRAKKLINATETDSLTGLYNRDYFFEYANRMYREKTDVARDAVVLNIDQFHSINALNGREFGDRILRVLGNEVRAVASESDGIAGRFGADRFDIYCLHTADYHPVFERLQKKLNEFAPNASIRIRMGVMPWQKKLEPVQLFDRARTACNMVRGRYNDRLVVFDEKIRERELYGQRLLNDLRHALDNFEFEVYYQPKYDISAEAPKLVSTEALVRWQHPEFGMISPCDFVSLFEQNGKIGEVDKFVWAEAAKQISRWRAQYGITLPVSINLSRVDIFDPTLEKTLDDILVKEDLEHDLLRLE
ncbi:MAG: transporter substrate-binding domain-containing protein, partial [Clostridia bacterium]|nr:transporter substrate-binding domain-containing protein [Clostridia bacterium]